MYPRTQVIGFDLEDTPHTLSTPLNYQFQRGNLLNGLPFAAQQFQYVHQRLLVAAIPLDKWPWVIGEALMCHTSRRMAQTRRNGQHLP